MTQKSARRPSVAHLANTDLTLRALLLPQLRHLEREGFDVTAVSARGPWVPGLEAAGIRHVAWPSATRAWSPRADARAALELLGILSRERFDLVHTHNPKPGILGRAAARLVSVPGIVNTVHGFWVTPRTRPSRRLPTLALEGLAARLSDLELYQSEEDLTWARRIGVVSESRSRLLGNGVDLDRFDPAAVPDVRRRLLRAELGIAADAPVVGTVGRLVEEKGYRELFAAARAIRARRPEVRFVAVGDREPEKADALSEEEIRSVRGDVICLGWRDDVRDLLALMDVFVLASWREGLPRAAIEAAAMGRALVLTDIPGCREVARDGREGMLVPPGDAARLAGAITCLLDDAVLRAQLAGAARARALERFDERHVFATLVREYERLLRPNGSGGRGR